MTRWLILSQSTSLLGTAHSSRHTKHFPRHDVRVEVESIIVEFEYVGSPAPSRSRQMSKYRPATLWKNAKEVHTLSVDQRCKYPVTGWLRVLPPAASNLSTRRRLKSNACKQWDNGTSPFLLRALPCSPLLSLALQCLANTTRTTAASRASRASQSLLTLHQLCNMMMAPSPFPPVGRPVGLLTVSLLLSVPPSMWAPTCDGERPHGDRLEG